MSAYEQLKTTLEGIIPSSWKFVSYEPTELAPESFPDSVTGLTMKVRTVRRLPAAPIGAYEVEWILTVTAGTTSRPTADPTLFDDLIGFLADLDGDPSLSWLTWTQAEKAVGDDFDRLTYDITLTIHTQKEG